MFLRGAKAQCLHNRTQYSKFQDYTTRTRPYVSESGPATGGSNANAGRNIDSTICATSGFGMVRSDGIAGRFGAILLVEKTLMKTKEGMASRDLVRFARDQFRGYPGSVASSSHVTRLVLAVIRNRLLGYSPDEVILVEILDVTSPTVSRLSTKEEISALSG